MTRSCGVSLHINEDRASRERVIFLGVPTFGMVSIRWHAHLLQLKNPLNRSVFHAYGVGYEVGQARNYLVEQALNWQNEAGHTVSHVFFVDDDTLIPPYALDVLLSRHRPIVSGLYYAKTESPQPLILMGPGQGTLHPVPRNTVVECYAHGMGCTLIELRVFRELLERRLVEYETLPNGQRLPQFFKTTRDQVSQADGHAPVVYNETEDVYFLKRAAEAGFQPAVDTSVFAFHWDQKSGQAYPLHYWEEFQRTGNVIVGEEVAAKQPVGSVRCSFCDGWHKVTTGCGCGGPELDVSHEVEV